ncbi:hypothetical protein E8E11_011837 [Didymella keratinophila]|nr:hypothetical protein E8E11_011837 [Didymella keratinophila]
MGFRENFSTDLRLRNLTIYAQWVSVSAALMLFITNILLLVPRFHSLSGLTSAAYYVPAIQNIIEALFLPLAPLALDLSRYVPPYMLYVSVVAWFVVPIGHIVSGSVDDGVEIVKVVVLLFTIWLLFVFTAYNVNVGVVNSYLYPDQRTTGATRVLNSHLQSDLRTRAGVNFIYFEMVLLFSSRAFYWTWKGDWRPPHRMIDQWYRSLTALFGIAVILYIIAWKKRHQWVSSVTLGGTAIEPMVLTVPLTGPVYQSVGDEATEGAIRLV